MVPHAINFLTTLNAGRMGYRGSVLACLIRIKLGNWLERGTLIADFHNLILGYQPQRLHQLTLCRAKLQRVLAWIQRAGFADWQHPYTSTQRKLDLNAAVLVPSHDCQSTVATTTRSGESPQMELTPRRPTVELVSFL